MYKEIPVEDYDKKSPEFYRKEKCFIQDKLDVEFDIHHIGSSAVPGLGGKNWIDILLLVDDEETAKQTLDRIEELGYIHSKTASSEHREFFKRKTKYFGKEKRFHLHLMWKTESKYTELLAFRDYLCEHPEEAERYYDLKKSWKKKADNSDEFTELKTEYVKEIVEKAQK